MDLYLVRHAAAFERDSQRWPDDGDRPLTRRGEKRFRAVARGLRRLAPTVAANMSSPLVRAWRTAELLAEEAGWPAPSSKAALAEGSPERLLELIRADGLGSAALVGHEPDLSRFASYLLAGAPGAVPFEMKKGGVACLVIEAPPAPGSALLRWFATPKLLRAIGR
jgi:phosphohistidine phosphatase